LEENMSTFKAVRIDKVEGGTKAAFVDFDEKDLMAGDVDVRVSYSTVNYKDGLAVTGKSPVVRRFPMIPGIDFAGTVEASRHPEFKPGDKVVLNGWGVGETHLGGYAQRARVSGDWLIGLPAGLSEAEAMAIGTAGYTAMLALIAIERLGVRPEHGPALVTGASGGVGSVAIALLAKAGWHVIAMTGRPQEASYLQDLGAAEIIDRSELAEGGKPLMAERWAAGVDSVGSRTLANALAHTKAEGAIAACGLAQGLDLPATVAPFILRGVSLLGINSVMVAKPRRVEAWRRLAAELDRAKLAQMTSTIPFAQVIDAGKALLENRLRGRTVVEIG
jgi:acrylyl-CoA reductase (NADPH)